MSALVRVHRLGSFTLVTVAALAATGLLAPAAIAASPIANSYYASNTYGPKSADIEMYVVQHSMTKDLALVCYPKDTSLIAGTSYGFIVIHAPRLAVHNGRLSYKGTAKITVGTQTVGKTSLTLNLRHVTGPTIHFTDTQGDPAALTTSFKGSTSSAACASLPAHGSVTLFGDSAAG